MSGGELGVAQAKRFVEARLGRTPQDMLEAAVVLEAWAGVPAREALGLARRLMRASPQRRLRSTGRPSMLPGFDQGAVFREIALMVSVVAVACWSVPLGSSLGSNVLAQALTLALPLTLGLQWALRSMFLGHRDGLAHLARRRLVLAIAALALVALPAAALGLSGTLAAVLTIIWIGATIMTPRRWALAYVLIVGAASGAMALDADPLLVVEATAAAITLAVAAALRTTPARVSFPPGPWGRALASGAIGVGLGVLLVADASVGWGLQGTVLAVSLVPSTLASVWAGARLWRFQRVIQQALVGVAVLERGRRDLAGRSLLLLVGALARFLAVTTTLSLLLLLAASWLGLALSVSLLVGFGLVTLATLLVSLLASVGWEPWALLAVALGVAAESSLSLIADSPVLGADLITGASLTALGALVPAIVLLARPARTLATTLWIS